MILSGREIQKHIGSDILIEPYDPKRVNPNSYNLSLHNELLVYTGEQLDMKQENPTERLDGGVRGHWLCGLLDAGDLLHPAGAHLSGRGDPPDLLP